MAEKALEQLELDVAETAMVQCKDFPGIQFVKRIRLLQNDTLRKAEIAAYLNNFDLADKLYFEMDRKLVSSSLFKHSILVETIFEVVGEEMTFLSFACVDLYCRIF